MGPLRPYERLPEAIEYEGHNYSLDLSYAAVFAAADALEDARLNAATRLSVALDILVQDPHPEDPELLQAVLDMIKEDRPKLLNVGEIMIALKNLPSPPKASA